MNKNQIMFEFVSSIIDEMMTNVSAQLPGIESPAKSATYFKNKYPDEKDDKEQSLNHIKKYLSPDE